MAKPPVENTVKERIRRQSALLAEVELAELLEGGEIDTFEIVVKRLDGSKEKIVLHKGLDMGVDRVRRDFFGPRILALVEGYRAHCEDALMKAYNGK